MKRLSALLAACLIAGCATIPPDSFVVTPEIMQRRQIETRRYDGIREEELISAGAGVLQDLGFNLENSETRLGVLTASKQRSAVEPGEIAAAILMVLLRGPIMAVSKDQTVRVTLVVRPVIDRHGRPMADSHFVRVTMQRIVRRTDNSVYVESLHDAPLYREFYERVSKSVFIEAQKI